MPSPEPAKTMDPATRQIAPIFLDNPNADVILRSSDHVDFRVVKLFLSFSSSFFDGIFKLPPPVGEDDDEIKDGLRIVNMEEKSKTIEALLLFCYPAAVADFPVFQNLGEAFDLLAAADKYGMEEVTKKARQWLSTSNLVVMDPLRTFAMACHNGWEEEAKIAARYMSPGFLAIDARDYSNDLEYFTYGQYIRGLEYRLKCIKAEKEVVDSFLAMEDFGLHLLDSNHTCYDRGNGMGWLSRLIKGARNALESRPCRATLRNTDLVQVALRKAFECGGCKETAVANLNRLCALLESELEKKLSGVSGQIIGAFLTKFKYSDQIV
jgi:hypothetical protein